MVRPSYASVTATLALFISLGGGAYAAGAFPANSVGAKQIKKSAVERAKIKNNAVDGSKVLDNSLTGDDVNEAKLAKVPAATAADTATHANAAAALDRALYRSAGGSAGPGQTSAATATCDPGTRVVGGGVNLGDLNWAYVVDTYPDAGNTAWSAHVSTYSDSPGPVGFTVSAICAPISAAG
jgi:hypothetical protein